MTVWYIGLIEEDGRFRAIDEHEEIPRRAALGLNHYPALLATARAMVDSLNREPVILDWIAASKEAARALSALRSAVEAARDA